MMILKWIGLLVIISLTYSFIGVCVIAKIEDALGNADLSADGQLIVIWPVMALIGIAALLRRKATRMGVRL